jgi:hypothetical protein
MDQGRTETKIDHPLERLAIRLFGLLVAICGYGLIAYIIVSEIKVSDTFKVTVVIVGITLAFISGGYLVFQLIKWSVTILPYLGHNADYPPQQVIESQYHPLQAQLPAPRVVTVPRYTTHGKSQPLAPVHLTTTTEQGDELTVPLSKFLRFLELPTPARSEWIGDKSTYGDCLEFCRAHGLLDNTPRGGVTWRPNYSLPFRLKWVSQWNSVNADTDRLTGQDLT